MLLRTVDPTPADLERLAKTVPAGTPVTMLNLLRFHKQAQYPAGSGHTPCTGREAFARYAEVAQQKVKQVGGQPMFMTSALARFIGPVGEEWDTVVLVNYPSVQAFLQMLAMPDYRAAAVHRSAALEDARLTVLKTPL